MKKTFLILLTLFNVISSFSQDSITIGSKHHIFSKALNEERNFWIYLPPDYDNKKFAPAKYPVVYLLDAENNFHSYTGIQHSLAKGPYAMIPQMIVVGITNTDRTRDLTPTESNRDAFYDKGKKFFKQSGGNKNFITFLETELRPYIDSHYRTSGYNILNGHSFGGLTAVNILLHHTKLFNAYTIIDPSLWWDNEIMIKKADSIFKNKDFNNHSIYVAMANKISIPQDTTTDMARGIRKFEKLLESKIPSNLRWAFKYYENEDHGTIPIPAEYDGLRFIFKDHLVKVKEAVQNPSLVEEQYAKLSKATGFIFLPSESYLDWMGNFCLEREKTDSALAFFQMAKMYYSNSSNVFISLGQCYEKKGNKTQAQLSYKKALLLSPENKKVITFLKNLNN
ncbi:alpha/beta hydrolase-fold protein [Flavobacterium chungangense]|uniref:Histidine kinase n=1 Tax=Flavobacterium chungangense TaxID=554283 RepID=A0A6V6YW59_9FLAO|nr:alpha/beta hydrolase-fold protein [Flavobacterium chungangense]CAD0003685.1 histidine kinase [Flavobacterium chungangense]